MIDVNHNSLEILNAVKLQIEHGIYDSSKIFGNGNSGTKIADILSKVKLKYHKTITF